MYRPAILAEGLAGHAGLLVPGVEFFVFFPAGKKRGFAGIGAAGAVLIQALGHPAGVKGLIRIEGRAQRHIIQAVFRADAGNAQGIVKTLAQHIREGERAAQIQHIALDGTALGQAGDGLVHHRFINAGGHVAGAGALVQQGLHVAFGKHTAAAGNGIGALGLAGGQVHFLGAHLEQGGHLVDKGAGAAGTAAVHPHLGAAGEEEDLGILAAQLDDTVGLGGQLFHGHTGGEHFLHKGDAAALGQAHARRTGDGQLDLFTLGKLRRQPAQQLLGLFQDMAVVTLVNLICDLILFIQDNTFNGGGPNVQACFPQSG